MSHFDLHSTVEPDGIGKPELTTLIGTEHVPCEDPVDSNKIKWWKPSTLLTYILGAITGGKTLIGGTGVTDILKLQGTTGNGTATSPAMQVLVGNNGNTVAETTLNNGNKGIGMNSPSRKLVVAANDPANGLIAILSNTGENATTGAKLLFDTTGIGDWEIGMPAGANAFAIKNFGAEQDSIRIDSTGNVALGTISPNANALLDLTSTTKAFMPPRMTTTQKNAIASPTSGMVVYDSSLGKLCVYGAAAWEVITSI